MTAVAPLAAATTPGDFVAASAAFAQHTCDPGSGTAPLAVRLELHRLGLPPLALSWLARDDGEDVAEASYRLLFACTAQVNRDDDAEIQTCVMTASHAQLFALGEKEVTRRPPRAKAVVKLLEVLQALSLVRESADVVASSSAMAASLSALLRDEDRSPVGQNALNVLKNLALFPSAHAALLRADVMKNCLGLIGMLSSQKEDELLTALRAASLVCRLHGSDESGPGSDVIQGNNHAVIAKMMWVLDEVVRAGPSQRVLGSSWDPANILSDLVALAKSDRNKPLLAPSVSLVVAALDKRASNKRLVARSITLLALLLWEPTQCQPAFHAQRKPLAQVLGSVDALALPIVSRRELASLKEWLATGASPSSAPPLAPRRPSLLARISSQGGARKHVFISYCWDDSVPVLACHTLLKEREFPLWLDRENMGENLIDSMVDGLQRAAVVVAFMSPSYKVCVCVCARARPRGELTRGRD